MTPASWRFIDTGDLDGPTNMAVDEALLASFDPERSKPVLRLYGWNPPALSLGRFQDPDEVLDLGKCRKAGLPVVRRATGGGVIYHADEITYSVVCAPRHLPPAKSVKDSFRILTSFLLDFYRSLGLEPAFAEEKAGPGERLGERTEFCFAGRESCDIVVRGRKIGGNAQRRLRHALLQHGSIPLENRALSGAKYLLREPEGVGDGTLALREAGVLSGVAELKKLLAQSFTERLGVRLEESELVPEEVAAAEKVKPAPSADERKSAMM
jgi:lipoyl(octanoyl) transferase